MIAVKWNDSRVSGATLASNHYISDWLRLHNICDEKSVSLLKSALAEAISTLSTPLVDRSNTGWRNFSLDDALKLVQEAFTHEIPHQSTTFRNLFEVVEIEITDEITIPYTVNRGGEQPPLVRLNYQGHPEDIICLAHELGHAIQYLTAKDEFIPPVTRECAAFVAEVVLLKHCEKEHSNISSYLNDVWVNESATYLGYDAEDMFEVLSSPSKDYYYRVNYPVARMVAETILRSSELDELWRYFTADFRICDWLHECSKNEGPPMKNYLPEIQQHDDELDALKAYNNYQPCWFKPEAPDFAIYPKAREAKCVSVTLNPGELLVQPAGWFHQVYALDSPNMSVSYFWRY